KCSDKSVVEEPSVPKEGTFSILNPCTGLTESQCRTKEDEGICERTYIQGFCQQRQYSSCVRVTLPSDPQDIVCWLENVDYGGNTLDFYNPEFSVTVDPYSPPSSLTIGNQQITPILQDTPETETDCFLYTFEFGEDVSSARYLRTEHESSQYINDCIGGFLGPCQYTRNSDCIFFCDSLNSEVSVPMQRTIRCNYPEDRELLGAGNCRHMAGPTSCGSVVSPSCGSEEGESFTFGYWVVDDGCGNKAVARAKDGFPIDDLTEERSDVNELCSLVLQEEEEESCADLQFSISSSCGGANCQGACVYEEVSCTESDSARAKSMQRASGTSDTCKPCSEATAEFYQAAEKYRDIIQRLLQEEQIPSDGRPYIGELQDLDDLYREIAYMDASDTELYKEIKLERARVGRLEAKIASLIGDKDIAEYGLNDQYKLLTGQYYSSSLQDPPLYITDNKLLTQYYTEIATNRYEASNLDAYWNGEPYLRDSLYFSKKAVESAPNDPELEKYYRSLQLDILEKISVRLNGHVTATLGHSLVEELPDYQASVWEKSWGVIETTFTDTADVFIEAYDLFLNDGSLNTIRLAEAQDSLGRKMGVDLMRNYVLNGGDLIQFYELTSSPSKSNQEAQVFLVREAFDNRVGENAAWDIKLKMLQALELPDVILLLNDGERQESGKDWAGRDISTNFEFLKEGGFYGDFEAEFPLSKINQITNSVNVINGLNFLLPGAQCIRGGRSLAQIFSSRFIWAAPGLRGMGTLAGEATALGLGLAGTEGLVQVGVPRPLAELVGGLVAFSPQGRIAKMSVAPLRARATQELFEETVENVPNGVKAELIENVGVSASKADEIAETASTNFRTKRIEEVVAEINDALPSGTRRTTRGKLEEIFKGSYRKARQKRIDYPHNFEFHYPDSPGPVVVRPSTSVNRNSLESIVEELPHAPEHLGTKGIVDRETGVAFVWPKQNDMHHTTAVISILENEGSIDLAARLRTAFLEVPVGTYPREVLDRFSGFEFTYHPQSGTIYNFNMRSKITTQQQQASMQFTGDQIREDVSIMRSVFDNDIIISNPIRLRKDLIPNEFRQALGDDGFLLDSATTLNPLP
ncbi:MAG: hypothetical protein ABIB47_05280, partial [Candidatus Woesearchaeota archaeon]